MCLDQVNELDTTRSPAPMPPRGMQGGGGLATMDSRRYAYDSGNSAGRATSATQDALPAHPPTVASVPPPLEPQTGCGSQAQMQRRADPAGRPDAKHHRIRLRRASKTPPYAHWRSLADCPFIFLHIASPDISRLARVR